MSAPIIFCHYGNRGYLRYVLECARLTNSGKDIILLGDASNRRVARRAGIRHVPFRLLDEDRRLREFESAYRLVQGPGHRHMRGGRDWIEFVFRRWFYVGSLVREENFGSFWHFDSDNMLLTPLVHHEQRFSAYDCTDQCNGRCMNGYISGATVVDRYLDKINNIFHRPEYLQEEESRLREEAPDWAFTEMDAYRIFKDEDNPQTVRLNAIHEGTSFDDCVCQVHGMTMETLRSGKTIKAVLLSPDGRFFCRRQADSTLVEMSSLNLSWVPLSTFRVVLRHRRLLGTTPLANESTIRAAPTLGQLIRAGEGERFSRRLMRRMRIGLGRGGQ